MSDSMGKVLAMHIDLKRCIGCNACSLACKQENDVHIGGLWAEVYGIESGTYPNVGVRALPMLCHHCGEARCKKKCDALGHGAILQRPDGIVYIDPKRCVGCQQCVSACRYAAISFNPQTLKAEKCHFCMHRVDAGLPPACVITCLAITRQWGYLDQLQATYPNAKAMGDKVKVLYSNLGGEPKSGTDAPTNGYPDPIPFHG